MAGLIYQFGIGFVFILFVILCAISWRKEVDRLSIYNTITMWIYFLDVLRSHLLPNVICSGAIVGRMRSCNALGECMNLTGDGHGGVTVGEVPLVQRDLMATNGVLHSIDEVRIPDEGQLKVTFACNDVMPFVKVVMHSDQIIT